MNDHPQRRDSDRHPWKRFGRWVAHNPLIAYIALVLGIALAFGGVWKALHANDAERDARRQVQAEINRYVCTENNKQDRILAGLVEASVKTSGGNGSSFGEGLDKSKLTPFDIAVLRTIAKVQRLSATANEGLNQVFEKALRQLRKETPCNILVAAFNEASDTKDYKQIRNILRAQEQMPKSPHKR